ncbi:MAG: DoxX family membrane protein [Verrucomicrobiota bacterium]
MPSKKLLLAARILIPCVFIGLGAERLLMAAGLFQTGAPVSAAAVGFSLFELTAGLLIAFGRQVELLSWIMAIFLAVDAAASHPFWNFSGPEFHAQLLHFLKNLSSIGGLLLLAWVAAGGKSRGALAK